jgi:hypothetical protein
VGFTFCLGGMLLHYVIDKNGLYYLLGIIDDYRQLTCCIFIDVIRLDMVNLS